MAEDQGRADVLLARALAQAVQEVGRNLATDPRRVQGMVSDVLGVESRSRRAEIDAVVIAAEEAIPEDMLAGRLDADAALVRLRERGLDDPVAHFAVEVWRYALGMLGDGAQPPSLTNSLEVVTDPDVTDRSSEQTELGGCVPPTSTPARSRGLTAERHDRPRVTRAWLLAAASLVLVIVLVGAVLAFGPEGDGVSGAPGTSVADTTMPPDTTAVPTTTLAPTTTVPAPPQVSFDPEAVAVGELRRTWVLEAGQLVSTLAFTNPSAADVVGAVYEVVPKSMAATADLIVSEPAHTVFKADPVIGWSLTVPAGGAVSVTYRVDVPDESTIAELERWKAEQLAESALNKVERETPPALVVATPNETVVDVPAVDLTGTADVTSAVTVNGVPVTVNADGTWGLNVAGLIEGPNPITVTAANVYGTVNTVTTNVVYFPPPPPTEAPVAPAEGDGGSSGGGGGSSGGGGGSSSGGGSSGGAATPPAAPPAEQPPAEQPPAPPEAPPELPPPPPAPVVHISGPSSVMACTRYSVNAQVSNATSGRWNTSWGWSESARSTSLGNVSGDNASSYSIWIEYTAEGPGGRDSARVNITVSPDNRTDYVRPYDECQAAAG